jgi:tetratricopeptide (TPR) repeat protein
VKILDKYEFRIKTDQIKKLMQQKDYPAALKIADTIDWSKVRNMSLLTIISELYEKNGRFEDSLDILLIVYERYPAGRTVVYKLCELYIELGKYKEAIDFYQEYVKIAPYDTSRLILKYKICKGQGKDLDGLIKILEELKSQDYHEEWAYELAKLYHQARRINECVAECDEIDLWFGEGYYVNKALELKMRYQPLTPTQMKKYENRYAYQEEGDGLEEVNLDGKDPEIKVRTVSFDTLGLQAELAKSIDMLMNATKTEDVEDTMENVKRLVEESQIPDIAPEPIDYRKILAEDEDGQISFYVPEEDMLEKQITGQMTIEEVLQEWEKTKESAERAIEESRVRQLEKVRNRALEETGSIMERLKDVLPTAEADRAAVEEALEGIEPELPNPQSEIAIAKPEQPEADMEEPETEAFAEDADIDQTKEWIPPKHYHEAAEPEIPVSEPEIPVPEPEIPVPEPEIPTPEPEIPALEPDIPDIIIPDIPLPEPQVPLETADLLIPDIPVPEPRVPLETADLRIPGIPEPEPRVPLETANLRIPGVPEPEPEPEPVFSREEGSAGQASDQKPKEKKRGFNQEQREILSYFMEIPTISKQLEEVGCSYTNSSFIVISGAEGSGRISLATRLIKAAQLFPDSVGKKIAKTTGSALNEKKVAHIFEKMAQGSLIIEKAEELTQETLENLYEEMERYKNRLQVYFIGRTKPLTAALQKKPALYQACEIRIQLPVYRNDDLVTFARAYARGQKYSIGDMGVLALYTRIGAMQTQSHKVTLGEVKELVDEAIANSGKFTPKKFLGRLFAVHIDEEGLIVLNEQDFQEKETRK